MSDIVERRIGKLTVGIERESCISSGNCIKVAPGLFALDEESIVAFHPEAEETEDEQVIEACRICPVEALLVKDDTGEQIVP